MRGLRLFICMLIQATALLLALGCSVEEDRYDTCIDGDSFPDGDISEDGDASEDDNTSNTDGDTIDCGKTNIQFDTDTATIDVSQACASASLILTPSLKNVGTEPALCMAESDSDSMSCSDGKGRFSFYIEPDGFSVVFEAITAIDLQELAFEGELHLDGAESWLSNGFQSWSQSGMISIGAEPSAEDLAKALAARGDDENIRQGRELSWFYTLVGGGETAFFAGMRKPELKPYIQVFRNDENKLMLRLVARSESLKLAAGEKLSLDWYLGFGDAHELFENYAEKLPSRRMGFGADAAPKEHMADAGWNSWYELWDKVDETAIRENAALLKEVLDGKLPEGIPTRVVIDDGWQVMWGEWQTNEKFSSGMDGLAADLKAQGFEVGIWMAPLLVDADSALVTEHPGWFVDGPSYNHSLHGEMKVLDVTEAGAAQHIRDFIGRVVGWGYDMLKLDFLFAGAFEGGRAAKVSEMQAYEMAMQLLREAAGEKTIILAVGAPPLPCISYVDAWRVGGDIAFEPTGPSWFFIVNQARSIAARWPICRRVLCDADPPLLRVLPRNEVEAGVWVAALAGGAFFLSDDLRTLPLERRGWGIDTARINTALGGVPAVPEDIFPDEAPEHLTSPAYDFIVQQNNHVLPTIWKMPDGSRLGLNPSAEEATIDGQPLPAQSAVILEGN